MTTIWTRTCVALVVAWLALPAAAAGGGGGGGGDGSSETPASSNDPDFRQGMAAAKAQDWPQVLTRMHAVVQREPNNADAWNELGHAARRTGDLPAAFAHYEKALQINPRHRGAHEYVGEAYLVAGNVAKAEEHLKALDKLCLLPCEEYTELKEAIQRWRKEHPQ
jgi:cytochrome c-type biogenesis protein CcmH/NrfG